MSLATDGAGRPAGMPLGARLHCCGLLIFWSECFGAQSSEAAASSGSPYCVRDVTQVRLHWCLRRRASQKSSTIRFRRGIASTGSALFVCAASTARVGTRPRPVSLLLTRALINSTIAVAHGATSASRRVPAIAIPSWTLDSKRRPPADRGKFWIVGNFHCIRGQALATISGWFGCAATSSAVGRG